MNDNFLENQTLEKQSSSLWTLSNGISILRALMVVPAIHAIQSQNHAYIVAVALTAYGSDLLDGWVARKRNEISEWGKIIDPLADKIFVGVVVSFLVLIGKLAWWFVAVVLARDILIVLVGSWASKKLGYVLPSNYAGKAAVAAISCVMLSTLLDADSRIIWGFELLSLVLMSISLATYGVRLVQQLQKNSSQQ